MIEIWMENHFVSDGDFNIVNLEYPNMSQGMTNEVRFKVSVDDTTYTCGVQLVSSTTNRISDTKYNI